MPFTAFSSRGKARQVTARLIVRRVRDANPDHVAVDAQGELFRVWRHHAVFTDSPLPMLDAEADHRRHAIVEQVIADLKNSALAHLPSGNFAANSAWLVLAAMAFNLTRAAGALGLELSRQSQHRHPAPAADQRRRSRHPLRPAIDAAPARRLALGRGLAANVHRRDRTANPSLNPSTAATARPENKVGTAEQIGRSLTPTPQQPTRRSTTSGHQTARRIRAKPRSQVDHLRWLAPALSARSGT